MSNKYTHTDLVADTPLTGMLFGTFDGLHMGHIWLIESAQLKIKKLFGQNTKLYIVVGRDSTVAGVKGVSPKQNERERMQAIKNLFPECRVVLGHKTNRMYWLRKVQPDVVFLGYDQRAFVSILRREIRNKKYEIRIVRLKPFKEATYKSSKIKTPHIVLRGEVVHGKKAGRSIGYPTANIHLSKAVRAVVVSHNLHGIYASRVLLGTRSYIGATVVGARTHEGGPLVETHIIGYTGDCYGKTLTISLEKKLRDFKTYTTEVALVRDIEQDIQNVQKFMRQ